VHNALAIARRERRALFDAPTAYAVVALYVALVGGFAFGIDDAFEAGVASPRGVFGWAHLFLVMLAPALTMRLFAEERRAGTMELLQALPLRDGEIVAGKFLAACVLLAGALAATFPMVLTLAWLGVPEVSGPSAPAVVRVVSDTGLDWGGVVTGYLGLFASGAAMCAIGLAASAWSNHSVVAFLLALVLCVFPWAAGLVVGTFPASWQATVTAWTFQAHVEPFFRGVVALGDLAYWCGLVAVALQAACLNLAWRRWSVR
jgi:ABC-2 type transport system permease protein